MRIVVGKVDAFKAHTFFLNATNARIEIKIENKKHRGAPPERMQAGFTMDSNARALINI